MSYEAKLDPVTCSLDVYDAREGEEGDAWNKEYGLLFIPDDWGYLARGDVFLTRTVKRLGPTWVRKKNDRRRRITRTLGLYAPLANIRAAEAMAEQTHADREVKRKIGAAARARKEERHRAAFRKAVLAYLDFASRHTALAKKIADGVVKLACPAGSGTVART